MSSFFEIDPYLIELAIKHAHKACGIRLSFDTMVGITNRVQTLRAYERVPVNEAMNYSLDDHGIRQVEFRHAYRCALGKLFSLKKLGLPIPEIHFVESTLIPQIETNEWIVPFDPETSEPICPDGDYKDFLFAV
jgi:hypothetical protein